MSQENLERVRATYEFANRTHTPDLNAFAPDCAWHTREDLPDAGARRGHDGLVVLASEWFGAFDDFRLDIEELIDAGDSVVVVTGLRGRVKSSRGGSRPSRDAAVQDARRQDCRGAGVSDEGRSP